MVNDYDKFAEERQKELINGMKPSHRFVEKPMMTSMMPKLDGKKILMLGCGSGEESMLLETFNAEAKLMVGIDLSEKSISLAKQTYTDIEFIVGDMNQLPFSNESFDFVYSSLAVHYSATPETVYNEVYRVLKKDGLFLFSIGHPLRWASQEIEYNGEQIRAIACATADNSGNKYGQYHTFEKHYFSNFAWQERKDETLAFYVGSPSMHFKLLRKSNFNVLDFSESKCVDKAKEIDINYFSKYSEIPQFMAFLCQK